MYPRVCPEAAEKKKLLLLPGIELQFLGLLVSNLVIILIDLPRTLSVDTKPCIIVRIRFLEKGKLFFSGEKMDFGQNCRWCAKVGTGAPYLG